MTAEKFWEEFQALFSSNNNFLRNAKGFWKYRHSFTTFIMPYIGKILESNGFENKHQYEYYKIDVIGWKNAKSEISVLEKPANYDLKEHFWHLGVAIEHENDQFDWTDELVKLLYINCPLRVVIGYYPESLSEHELQKTTEYAANIINLANKEQQLISDKQQYLLILGENHTDSEKLGASTYRPYLYKNGAFIPLEIIQASQKE